MSAAKKLTVAEAADQWEKAERAIAEATPLRKQAAEVLKAHFAKTGRDQYKGRIGLKVSHSTILDQVAVKDYLGSKLAKYQKRIEKRYLTILGD
jgi:hypothetical protein